MVRGIGPSDVASTVVLFCISDILRQLRTQGARESNESTFTDREAAPAVPLLAQVTLAVLADIPTPIMLAEGLRVMDTASLGLFPTWTSRL